MSDQKKECGCASNDLLLKLIEQNNQLIQHLTQQSNQINELLLIPEDQEEENAPRYMDE